MPCVTFALHLGHDAILIGSHLDQPVIWLLLRIILPAGADFKRLSRKRPGGAFQGRDCSRLLPTWFSALGLYQVAEKLPMAVILRSRRRRRISQVVDITEKQILRSAQDDMLGTLFSNLLEPNPPRGPAPPT